MAKELPYFQFEPAQYLTGNIQFCSLEAQGLFTNVCAIYWQRECNLTLSQVKKKFDRLDLISELIDNDVIKTNIDSIIIEFLDEQFESITSSKLRLSEAGRKGALIKKQANLKPPLSEVKPTLKQPDEIREDDIKEDNKKDNINMFFESLQNSSDLEKIAMNGKYNLDAIKQKLIEFRKFADLEYDSYKLFVKHFKNWVNLNPPKDLNAPLKMVY